MDDALIDHRKVFAAGDIIGKNGPAIAIGMFAVGLMWTNKHLSNGFLPTAVVVRFAHVQSPLEIADALVRAGLWEVADSGFQIHDFFVYNVAGAAVKAERNQDRLRRNLYSDPEMLREVRRRDAGRCRYCGQRTEQKDRRSDRGQQFDIVDPAAGHVLANVVIACRGCNNRKAGRALAESGMALLPAHGGVQQ